MAFGKLLESKKEGEEYEQKFMHLSFFKWFLQGQYWNKKMNLFKTQIDISKDGRFKKNITYQKYFILNTS